MAPRRNIKSKPIAEVSAWIIVLSVVYAIFRLDHTGAEAIIPLLFAFLFAKICSDWAIRIRKNADIAWIVGFLFSLVGTIVYWLWYRLDIAKAKQKLRRK